MSVLLHGRPQATRVQPGDVVLHLLARPVGHDGLALLVHVEHQLVRLLPRVAEQLHQHERHVTHQVDRVVPDDGDPRPVRRDVVVGDRLVEPRPRRQDVSSRLTTFPVVLRGSSSCTCTSRGTAKRASFDRTQSCSSLASAVPERTTCATSLVPYDGSSTPITAASSTAGCARRTSSTWPTKTFSPPITTMSSSRPRTVSRPSSSRVPRSPVAMSPSSRSLSDPSV